MAERREAPAASTVDDVLLFRLNRIAALSGQPLLRYCEGRFGISRHEWRILAVLGRVGPCRSTELAMRTRLGPGPTSKAVTTLTGKALVARTPVPSDRRQVVLALTADGERIFKSLWPVVQSLNESLLAPLSAEERDALQRIVGKLEARLSTWMDDVDLPKADRRHRPSAFKTT